MGKHKSLLSLLFTFYSIFVFAQNDFSAKTWHFIDTSITKKAKLSDLLLRVNSLEGKAWQEQKYFYAARCLNYKMLIADLRTEDTLYFKNSAFIDSLLSKKELPLSMQYPLHVMHAYRISHFRERYKKFQQSRYERKDILINYASFTNDRLDSISQQHFETAKTLSAQIRNMSIDEALWLSADPLQFLYRPGLFDIVIAEQIKLNSKKYYEVGANSFIKKWIGLSQNEFIAKLGSLKSSGNNFFRELELYSDWLAYHQSNPPAYYFIETLARKYVYDLVKQNYPEGDRIYEGYLRQISGSPYNTVKAYAVYQLCLLLNSQGKKYFPSVGNEYDYVSSSYREQEGYDTAYRYYPAKALQLFQQNKQLLDSFAYLKNILLQMEQQIRSNDLQFSLQEYNLPGEPLLGELKFKNAEKLFYRIVRLNAADEFSFKNTRELVSKLMSMPVSFESSLSLPVTNDYNYHNTYVKLDALPAGNYRLLFGDKELSDTTTTIRTVYFAVTGIAVVNNDKRIYILSRKTGFPLAGAKVKAGYTKEIKKDGTTEKKYVSENYTVNKNGYITIRNEEYSDIDVYYNSDTVSESVNIRESVNRNPDDVFTKDEYDDLVEFYEDKATAYIYTDRSIYRPGQTVYYKAIFLTKNKRTGEPMLMSKQNLKGKLFGSVYKKWLKEEEPWLIINDPFNREMDSLKIAPNEFGSVSGSFKIPKTAATGEWEIEPDYIDKDWKYGTFKVEEYKRPSYEITIEKPKKELRIKDDFSFKVKVKSFAGAALNNVRINYMLQRSGMLPKFDSVEMKMINGNITDTVLHTTGYTNADGELEIFVKDSLLKGYDLTDSLKWDFDYDLDAETIDATGESYKEHADMTISSQPVRIKLPLADKYNRKQFPELLVTTEDKNAGNVDKIIRIKFYSLATNKKLYTDRKLTKADEWIYPAETLTQWFPLVNFYSDKKIADKRLIWETTINTAKKEKLVLSPEKFIAGKYIAEAVCEENGKRLGELNKSFAIFDMEENKLPETALSFSHLPYNSALAGDSAQYYFGSSAGETFSIFHTVYYSGDKKTSIKSFYEEQTNSKGIHQYKLKVPGSATDQLKLTRVCILNNQVFTHEEKIYITNNKTAAEPEIIIEKYRKKLSPGSKETFEVSIKTKNENIAAEMMTTMYDASLDKLEAHKWEKPYFRNYRNINTDWKQNINSVSKSTDNLLYYNEAALINPAHLSVQPLWWVNPLDYAYTEVMGDWNYNERTRRNGGLDFDMNPGSGYLFAGRAAGVSITNTSGLNEVVVVGYGSVKRKDMTGSISVMIRGVASLTNYNQPFIVLDGVIYEGDLSKIDPATITQGLVLKGADATAIYGSRASQGVLVLSTKGEIIFPKEPEPIITPRKNFNESAFFFPAVHADKDGFYSFSFTMPESVTEWNWKMLAHTKLAKFAYAERKLNTQLPLMVQPNMPRLLYQGDRIILQNRITNLDSLPAAGKIICKIEDAVTGNDLTAQLISVNQHNFSLNKKENSSSAFEIKVPVQQLNPLKIIVTVRSENFSDGEEHIIPVLSPKIFVRDNKPFYFQNNPDTILQLPILPKEAGLYGMSLSIVAKPQAALINSLPGLANYPYGCAEQTFNKLLANATAMKMMQTDKMAQQSFAAAKEFVEKENKASEKLPDELNEETMPWLNKANKSSLQQKQLFNLLDTSKTKIAIDELLQKLYKLQNTDGGLTWFSGGESSFYISAYVLKGFGMMEKENLLVLQNSATGQYKKFIQDLITYTDKEFALLFDLNNRNNLAYYIYARSCWQKQNPVSDIIKQNINTSLHNGWKDADQKSLYDQSLLIITSIRYANSDNDLIALASAQLNSIRQLAITDQQNGTRWKELSDADDLTISSEETIALLAEAFEESGSDDTLQNGILKWLLAAKNEHGWSSTKATAAAINLLYKKDKSAVGETQTITASIENKKLSVNDDMLNGSSYTFSTASLLPPAIQVKKEKPEVASGNISWYYFTSDSSLNYLNKDVQLSKAFYKWNEKENRWGLFSDNTNLKIADRIKVIVTIVSSKTLPFVFIDDKRAAAFEPADNSSGYEYGSGFSYYKSVRDAGFHFFAESILSGKHEISYELKVSQEGYFTSGPVMLQCMYKPEVTAYSNSSKISTAH